MQPSKEDVDGDDAAPSISGREADEPSLEAVLRTVPWDVWSRAVRAVTRRAVPKTVQVRLHPERDLLQSLRLASHVYRQVADSLVTAFTIDDVPDALWLLADPDFQQSEPRPTA